MKKERQKLILRIISEEEIGVQDLILERLREYGLNVTQATVSRDIKELSLVKILSSSGQYKYDIPAYARDKSKTSEEMFVDIFLQSGATVDIAMNTVVINTHTGMAQAVCAKLDKTSYKALVGTIAGDDTIFSMFRTEQDAKDFYNLMKEISNRVK